MDDEDETFVIRPAIEDVFGENVLHQLAPYASYDLDETEENL